MVAEQAILKPRAKCEELGAFQLGWLREKSPQFALAQDAVKASDENAAKARQALGLQ